MNRTIFISEVLANLAALTAAVKFPLRYGDPVPGDDSWKTKQKKAGNYPEEIFGEYLTSIGLELGGHKIEAVRNPDDDDDYFHREILTYSIQTKKDGRYKWNERGSVIGFEFKPAIDFQALYGIDDVTIQEMIDLVRLEYRKKQLADSQEYYYKLINDAKKQLDYQAECMVKIAKLTTALVPAFDRKAIANSMKDESKFGHGAFN